MSGPAVPGRDLIVLAADKSMDYALRGIIRRHASLGMRPVDFQVVSYASGFDPGCYLRSHDFLRIFLPDYSHALVVFDHRGSGQESRAAGEVEREVEDRLRRSGWGDRAGVVVIVPELEVWVWGRSREVDHTLGWRGQAMGLREWLERQGLWPEGNIKPPEPEVAFEAVLRRLKRPRSASIYAQLAERVSLRRCQDRSFLRLVQILRSWFPASSD
jgi:hypothetical protein